jgi:hypothetical protein
MSSVPEDVFFVLSFPGPLEGGVFGPHGEGDPGVVQDLPAEGGAA